MLLSFQLVTRNSCFTISPYSLLIFLRDIHQGYLSLEDADNEQSIFASELKNFDKGIKAVAKSFFPHLGTLKADYFQ